MALYRKYRPATFADVVGQEHVTDPLRTALTSGHVNHAYLFSGPRGCGKTSSARILARSLNCVQGPTPDPCGVCPSCVALAPEGPGSLDVVELDAASHGGVDDARDLRDRAFYAPAESRYRVFIIDEAHMVTTQGFNALLKIVEEPPEHLVFVFATTEPDKVLSTIRSCTHHYPFRLLPPSTMRTLLEGICAGEGVHVEAAVYPLVIRAGGGSARDSLSVLDQLLAGAGDEGVTYARAVALLGVTDVTLIDDMVSALAAEDGAAVFATVDRLVEAGHDPRRFASDLLQRFRDLVLLRVAPDAARSGLVDAPEDQLAMMATQADRLGAGTLTRFAEIVHTGLTEMRGATAPRLLLELLCARMLLPAADPAEGGAYLHRLERLERRLTIAPEPAADDLPERAARGAADPEVHGSGSPPVRRAQLQPHPTEPSPARETAPTHETGPAQATAAPDPAEATPADPAPAGALDAAAVRRVWQALLDVVREQSRATQVLLTNATATAVEGDVLVLTLPTAPLAHRLAEDRNVDMIRRALRSVLGVDWQIRCEHSGSAPGSRVEGTRSPPRTPDPPPERPGRSRRLVTPTPQTPPTQPRGGQVGDDEIPPPPEPAEPEPPEDPDPGMGTTPPDEDEALLAEAAAADGDGTQRRDPEDVALQLLAEQLGARHIDER
ncbi:MAG: DNA polymerase III subunit gamma and tau [Actinomycetota bacterium]|nr:DNA polymerase III subunit gamma and tau [Actinomycetota bacterium]